MSWTIRRTACCVKWLESDGHIQGGEIGIHTTNLFLQVDALGVVLVKTRALEIFCGKCHGFEITGSRERSCIVGRVFWQFRHSHLREQLSHKSPLHWVVVEKHHGIQAQGKLVGDGLDIGRFVVPVGLENGNVLEFQEHLRVLFKRSPRDLLIIL